MVLVNAASNSNVQKSWGWEEHISEDLLFAWWRSLLHCFAKEIGQLKPWLKSTCTLVPALHEAPYICAPICPFHGLDLYLFLICTYFLCSHLMTWSAIHMSSPARDHNVESHLHEAREVEIDSSRTKLKGKCHLRSKLESLLCMSFRCNCKYL